jgi:RsiW-degrading membrane proteinase PrsW (M82 family)
MKWLKYAVLTALLIGFWFGLIFVVNSNINIQTQFYQFNNKTLYHLEQEIETLEGIKKKQRSLNHVFYSKHRFIQFIEKQTKKKLDKYTSDFVAKISTHKPRLKPKYIFVVPLTLVFSICWFLILMIYYPVNKKRVKYLLWMGLIGGTFSCETSLFINMMISEIIDPQKSIYIKNAPILSFIKYLLGAINEEFWKFLVTSLIIFNSKILKTRRDAIVLSMMVGLGFATFENFVYVKDAYGLVFIRSLLCTPGHMCYAAVWGYGLAEAKIRNNSRLLISEVLPYFLLASTLHLIYNYFITSGSFYLIITTLLLEVITLLSVHFLLIRREYSKILWRQ